MPSDPQFKTQSEIEALSSRLRRILDEFQRLDLRHGDIVIPKRSHFLPEQGAIFTPHIIVRAIEPIRALDFVSDEEILVQELATVEFDYAALFWAGDVVRHEFIDSRFFERVAS